MPLFNFACGACGLVGEQYLSRVELPDPPCRACGGATVRQLSAFNVVFTGPLSASKYNDPKRAKAHLEGHWVWERDAAGKPHPTLIRTFDDQRDYCKRNGLINPKEMPAHAELVTVDTPEQGMRRVLDDPKAPAIRQELRSRGLPGQEV